MNKIYESEKREEIKIVVERLENLLNDSYLSVEDYKKVKNCYKLMLEVKENMID